MEDLSFTSGTDGWTKEMFIVFKHRTK